LRLEKAINKKISKLENLKQKYLNNFLWCSMVLPQEISLKY